MDHPAVAGCAVAEGERAGQRRAGSCRERLVVERDRGAERSKMLAEIGDGAEPGDAGKHACLLRERVF